MGGQTEYRRRERGDVQSGASNISWDEYNVAIFLLLMRNGWIRYTVTRRRCLYIETRDNEMMRNDEMRMKRDVVLHVFSHGANSGANYTIYASRGPQSNHFPKMGTSVPSQKTPHPLCTLDTPPLTIATVETSDYRIYHPHTKHTPPSYHIRCQPAPHPPPPIIITITPSPPHPQ